MGDSLAATETETTSEIRVAPSPDLVHHPEITVIPIPMSLTGVKRGMSGGLGALYPLAKHQHMCKATWVEA